MNFAKIIITTIFLMLFSQINFGQAVPKYPCLPKGITLDTVVSATYAMKVELSKRVFVKEELKRLNAKCVSKRLVDSNKRQIKFYRLRNCFGVQPPNSQEIINKEKQTLDKLREKYTVITLTSTPSGRPCERVRPKNI